MLWKFWTSKTFWAAVAGLCTTIGLYNAGEVSVQVLYGSVWAVVMVIFMRNAIEKSNRN